MKTKLMLPNPYRGRPPTVQNTERYCFLIRVPDRILSESIVTERAKQDFKSTVLTSRPTEQFFRVGCRIDQTR